MKSFSNFKKNKKYLLCVDSDGCVMDTMYIKHTLCFCPCMIYEWELYRWKEKILARWKETNLYTITRGINRFKGLALALSEINEQYTTIKGVDSLLWWAENAPELSNNALNAIIEENPEEEIFKKALSWSNKVNEKIDSLPKDVKLPFPFAKEALINAHRYADVAVVSSANLDAILEEWDMHGLTDCVDVIMSQSDGSKGQCISKLISKGYDKDRVIMCGDAPGDLSAADKTRVFFYPILVGSESKSWADFIFEALPRFLDGNYSEYGESKKLEFYNNLNK